MRLANSELVTAMSHDLRTPLTSLLAYLELMERGKYENQEQLAYFIRRSLEKTMQIKSMADKLFEYFFVYSSEWAPQTWSGETPTSCFSTCWGSTPFLWKVTGFRSSRSLGSWADRSKSTWSCCGGRLIIYIPTF